MEGFLQDDAGELTAQITRLLRDSETDNAPLILEFIDGGGVNPRLKGYLFAISLFHGDKEVKDRALELLKRYCSEETVKQAEKLRNAQSYYYNDSEYLGKYVNEEFDLLDFMLAYKMVSWHRVGRGRSNYFETAHQTLNLSYYPHNVLTEALETLDFVRFITLPSNKNFDVDASFSHLVKLPLESIYIDSVRMDVFPVVLFKHPNLRRLSIKRGSYRPRNGMEVPGEGGPYGCETLKILVIDGYPLTNEENFGAFPNLEEAVFQRCQLESFEFLRASKNLKHLNVKFNILKELPAFVSEFSELRTLELNGNPFKKIEINLEPLEKLEDLELKIQNKPYSSFRWY